MNNKLNILLKQGKKLFHTQDLALLWGISNRNTLLTAITRYVRQGILFRVHKGFYSVLPLEHIEPVELGAGALHEYAYLSTETVLTRQGILQQHIHHITFVSSVSRTLKIKNFQYKVRKLNDGFLFNGTGIIALNGIKIASTERAVADLLYYYPHYYFDNNRKVDWKKVRQFQKEIGYL